MSLELAVQIAIRSRLVTTSQVTALVPIDNILDRSGRPIVNPSIIIGEQQSVDDETINRDRTRVYSTLHVWRKEQSLADVKGITWAVRKAIARGRLELGSSFHCVDCFVSSHRYERDPDGETSHGIITIETLVEEIA